MYKKIKLFLNVIFVMTIAFNLLSCEDGLLDTFNDRKVYKLRDKGPAGGLIFYINPNWEHDGWRYLETAQADLDPQKFSNISTFYAGTSTAIGSGRVNCDAIVNQLLHVSSSAQTCVEYSAGGYSDWFLPSKDELAKMYVNLKSGIDENGDAYTPVGNLNNDNYWSSSEFNASSAFVQHFGSGASTSEAKGN